MLQDCGKDGRTQDVRDGGRENKFKEILQICKVDITY